MAALDKFARVAALRPALGAPTCGEGLSPENSPTPGLDECTLAKLLGATSAATSRSRAGGLGFVVPQPGGGEDHKVEGGGGKSRKMAFPGYGDNRVVRRH